MRFGHLVPGLGPISVCFLAPGSSMWSPLFITPSVGEDGGAPDGESDAPSDARDDRGPDGAPSDAAHEASMYDGELADGPGADVVPRADAGSGSGAALDPLTMSRYYRLEGAGTFELAILPAGAGSCTRAYFAQSVTLDSDQYTTIVLAQTQAGVLASPSSYLSDGADAGVPFGLLTFTDEPSPISEAARTRFVSAVIPAGPDGGAGPLSVSVLDSTADLVPLAAVIPPDQVSAPSQLPPVVDALGYHDGYALAGLLAFRIGPAGDAATLAWTSVAGELDLHAGTTHTAFILSAAEDPFQVLWCDDLEQEPVLTDCTLIRQ
jgi:hypothetical protein